MSLRKTLKRMFGSPVHIDDSGVEGAEVDADLAEELPEADEDTESLRRAEGGRGSAVEIMHEPRTEAFEFEKAEKSEDAEAEKSSS